MLIERKNTTLRFRNLSITNFCCVTNPIQIDYDMLTTKVKGENGCGKTIQYATALLYCMSGVIDDRFSEEKLVLSDVRANDTCKSSVTLNGYINDEPFTISRDYNGKKTTLTFTVNEVELKLPTIKQKQKEIFITPIGFSKKHTSDNAKLLVVGFVIVLSFKEPNF